MSEYNENDLWKCEKCGKLSEHVFRCKDCNKCDICGTTENLIHNSYGLHCRKHYQELIDKDLKSFEGDTSYTDEIVCPYCGLEHTDSWELDSDDGEYTCERCEYEFSYSRNISVDYSTHKIDKEEAKIEQRIQESSM